MQSNDGRQIVARGRIRVDARRALAKLREHLLVDLHLYATEITRAAVASKATFFDVEYDADDIVFTFDGHSVIPNDLPRLLDHVLGDGHSTDRPLRGLALGVNAALGLGPAYVDIYVRTPEQNRASKVRFVPSVLDSEGGELPEIEMVEAPKGMPERGTRVHLRRRLSMNVLKRAATREVPREIVLLGEALHAIPLKVTSRGAALPLAPRHSVLLRVPFKERDIRRGTLEIIDTAVGPQIEYFELGVLLLRKPFVTEPILPSTAHAQVESPIRVMIDADELPTNASRSALREDSQLTNRAEQGARDALVLALRSLVSLVTGKGKPLPGVEIVNRDPKKLEEALGAIVCIVAGALERSADLSEQARALLDLPLLQNAVGLPMSPRRLLQRIKGEVFVYNGKEPYDKDLEPWLDDVVWLRGKLVERILVGFAVQDAKTLITAAQAAQVRRRVLHSRPRTDPKVPDDEGHVVKETFRIEDGPFKGLHGQLALGAEGQRTGQRPTSVRIYIEGRHIDTLTIDRDKLPLAMDAAIAWDGKLLPKFSYEGVRDDAALRLAIFQLTRLALVALGAYLEQSVLEKRAPAERARVLPVVRAAIGAFGTAAKALDVEEVPAEPPLSAYTPIWTRGTWASADPERLPLSLAELKSYSDRTKAICYVAPGSAGFAPDGRPVVVVTNLEKQWLENVFPGVTFVPYERGLRLQREAPAPNFAMFDSLRNARLGNQASSETLPSMTFEIREARGIIAPSSEDQCLSLHAGTLLSATATNKFVEPAMIVVEHDATVPKPSWDGILWSKDALFLTNIRNDLLEKIVQAMEGQAPPSLRNFPHELGPILRSYLIEAVPRFRTKELGPRIEKLPLLFALDADARSELVSLADIAARFPDPATIPYLRASPAFPTLDWRPLLLRHDREVDALTRWAGARLRLATEELGHRSKLAQSELQKRAFYQKPKVHPAAPGTLADPDMPAKVWQEQPKESGGRVASIVAALPRKGVELPLASAEILYEERLVSSRPLIGLPVPVVARVHLASDEHVVGYSDVSPAGISHVESLVYPAACALAADLVARADNQEPGAFFQDRRSLSLVRALYACSVANPSRSDILAADFALRAASFKWPTVQGDYRSYGELVPGGNKLYYATARYEFWEWAARGRSELDAPIVYLPQTTEGSLAREILAFMGHEMVDVSSAVFALQSRRKPGSTQSGPNLSGSPEHPALRAQMSSLGYHYEGEIELIDGANTTVYVETLHGTTERLEVSAPIAFRAVIRVEDVELDAHDKKTLASTLAKAAVKLIESLSERLDELPRFVRVGLRAVVVTYARKGKNLSKKRQQMVVFPDILGGYHSVSTLLDDAVSPYPYVTLSPPYPLERRPQPPLCLTSDEASALSNHVPLDDVTERLRRELAAQQRRSAAPLSFIGLSTTQRLECLDTVPYAGDDANGTIGMLAPEHVEKRGIWVHKNRRPLCRLPDSAGWPLLAIINDDTIPENKTFDGIKGNGPKDRLRKAIRAQADEVFSKWFVNPNTVLACRKVQTTLLDDAVVMMGALWLPQSWLSAGSVDVRDSSNRFPMPRSFGASGADGLDLSIPIPVCGRLYIANTGAAKKTAEIHAATSAWLLRETTALVLEAAARDDSDPRAVEAYRWLLRLLGADVGKLEALAADGRRIDAAEIIETLKSKKEIWFARGEGHIEGHFPKGMPAFILRAEGQVLEDVLRARTSAVREFAALSKSPEPVKAFVDIAAFETAASPSVEPPVVIAPDDKTKPAVEEADDKEPATSWLQNLVKRVVVFFDRPAPMEPWTKELGPSLQLAIEKLGLTNTNVVTGVRYVRKGRPMVFDEASGQLVINRSHHAIRSLAARVSKDPRARLLLVVAAVREINRVLEVVTDATERRVLLSLLRGEAL
ncbi:MAG: hypothetical protein IPM54_45570 [Polyangiaceae bacterium]|nr:hypothetical protein [Polyangiaceae bacterium]